jgi:hypothetical protein
LAWQLDTTTDSVGLVFVLILLSDSEEDMFKENINLYIEVLPLTEAISAAVYAQECQKLL